MKAQLNLFEAAGRRDLKRRYNRSTHGGLKSRGRRKLERPLAANKPVHLTLKSSRAVGPWSFLHPKNSVAVDRIIRTKAKKFGVRVADVANVGNHLHLKLRFSSRAGFQNYLRAVTCLLARAVTGARRGRKVGPFWDGLAYTRIVRTALEERQLAGYLRANRLQANHGSRARRDFLERFNDWIRPRRARKARPSDHSPPAAEIHVVPPGPWRNPSSAI